jgi:hypothetical protein
MRFVAIITCKTGVVKTRSRCAPLKPGTYLDVAARVKAVHLIQKLKHGALNLTLTTRSAVIALRANRIDFICNEQPSAWLRLKSKAGRNAPMKTIDGASSSATRNSSRTSFGPSPKYF